MSKHRPLDPPNEQLELAYVPPQTKLLRDVALPAMKQWFRIGEAAIIFGVSKTQVNNWIDDGSLQVRSLKRVLDGETPPPRLHKRVTRESIVSLLNDRSRQVTT